MRLPSAVSVDPPTAAALGGLGLAGFAAGYGIERLAMRRLRPPIGPEQVEEFTEVPEATHRTIPMTDGGECHIVERGPDDGRPLVILHGLCHSSIAWHYQLVDLSDRFRVISVDHRGHGKSRCGEDGYGLHRLARDVVTVLEELDLHDVLLVGHSMGGMIGLRLCIDFPNEVAERVAGLVLVSTTANRLMAAATFGVEVLARLITPITHGGLRLIRYVPGGVIRTNDLSYLLTRLVGFGRPALPVHVEVTQALIAMTKPESMVESTASLLDLDVRNALKKIELPTLVVVGSRDKVTPPRAARLIADRIPNSRLEVLEGAGHMVQLERRKPLNDVLVSFADELVSQEPEGRSVSTSA